MNKSVLCIGAALIDELYFCKQNCIPFTSNPALKTIAVGGVVGNISQHLGLLSITTSLITSLGTDSEATFITEKLNKKGIDIEQSVLTTEATGKYISIINPDGNLVVAVCNDQCEESITPSFLETKSEFIRKFNLIIIDTNLSVESIQWIIEFSNKHQQKLIIEPVSVAKATKLASLNLKGVFMITPNEEELIAMANIDSSDENHIIGSLFLRGVHQIWVRKGNKGSVIFNSDNSLSLEVPSINIIDSTGAGDAALAGWVLGYINAENSITSLQLAHALALEVLQIKGATLPTINSTGLYTIKNKYYHEHQ